MLDYQAAPNGRNGLWPSKKQQEGVFLSFFFAFFIFKSKILNSLKAKIIGKCKWFKKKCWAQDSKTPQRLKHLFEGENCHVFLKQNRTKSIFLFPTPHHAVQEDNRTGDIFITDKMF